MTKLITSILFILITTSANADSPAYSCDYKNVNGGINSVLLVFNKEMTLAKISEKNLNIDGNVEENGDSIVVVERTNSKDFRHEYQLNQKKHTLEVKLHLPMLNKVNKFNGICKITSSNITVPNLKAPKVEDLCRGYGNLAAKIMEIRQGGVPMADAMDIASKSKSPIEKQLVIKAYEYPRLSSQEYVQRSIEDFRNEFYLACIKESVKFTK